MRPGAAEGSRETQARLGNVERALSVDGPARRQRLLAPWNALSTGRRVAVRTALLRSHRYHASSCSEVRGRIRPLPSMRKHRTTQLVNHSSQS